MLKLLANALLALFLLPGVLNAQPEITVTQVTQDESWTADNVYLLDGFVTVQPGVALTIEPGTVIKGLPGDGPDASALIVMRGAQIFADGTREQPIIFTAEADDLSDPTDLLPTQRGLWGGVAILGAATLNTATPVQSVEGVPESVGAIYGCDRDGDLPDQPECDDDYDSGVVRYVSIRHSGTALEGGDEIQGLTVAGVGRGTTIEYVESFASADDGFEFFGGTVNTKYLVSAFNDDDAFDYDQGWSGLNQFWFVIQPDDTGDHGGEFDGGDDPDETGEPFATPTIYNATFIGSGLDPGSSKANNALVFRANAGGYVYNSVFTEFKGIALTIEDQDATDADSRGRLEAGHLELAHNVFARLGAGTGSAATDLATVVPQEFARTAFTGRNNTLLGDSPLLHSISREFVSMELDPRPVPGSAPLTMDLEPYSDGFFTDVDYAGAFSATSVWIGEWTALSQLGYLDLTSTDVEDERGELPTLVTLEQNYPNPFNPSTTIEFALGRAQHVRLVIYDVMGREVDVLIDGVQPAGRHHIAFDASGLAGGTYVYVLRAGDDVSTRAMSIVK